MDCNAKHQICVVTGTRADYGILRRLLFRLKADSRFEMHLVVTGTHLSAQFGNTQDEILQDGFCDFQPIPIPVEDDSKEGMAYATGIAMTKFSDYFNRFRPDILVVLGDRFEILAAATAAHLMGIPIAHISGGDVTEGAVDDAIRHSITKMSSLHFPGCAQSAKRIIQMGEQPDSVWDVGEPGVENCLNLKLLSRSELADSVGFCGIDGNYAVVTFHPVTMENDTAESQVYALITAMDRHPELSYIITMANADAGGRAINNIWVNEKKKHPNWLVVSSLGVQRYLSAVKYAKLVIGNSSSGIIEAPSLGTPTINIGDRQKGRMMADSVICCEPDCDKIAKAMKEALSKEFQKKAEHIKSPFGDGTTSAQIVKILDNFLEMHTDRHKKQFYDIDFSL